jgi:Cft2 family RNA processing exonuclease
MQLQHYKKLKNIFLLGKAKRKNRMSPNTRIIFLLLLVTSILSYFLYIINDKTEKYTEEVQTIKKESSDFKFKYQTLKRINDSMFILIDKQNVKIITFQQKLKDLENDEKKVKSIIDNIDDSTLYRLLSETPY